jgi:hypothetical protein
MAAAWVRLYPRVSGAEHEEMKLSGGDRCLLHPLRLIRFLDPHPGCGIRHQNFPLAALCLGFGQSLGLRLSAAANPPRASRHRRLRESLASLSAVPVSGRAAPESP